MNAQDFIVGVDFTGIAGVNGGDLNNGIQLATPSKEADDTQGRGLCIVTTDTAANTPAVPDPTAVGFTRLKRFPWLRRPFAGQTDKSPRLYLWNDDALNDATYLKWIELTVDLTVLTNLCNNALASANNAVSEAQVANDTANTANTNANTAITTANGAVTTANTANTTANTANTNAALAQTSAANANTTALSAVALNSTPLAVNLRLLNSGIPYQKIRTNAAPNATEWFSEYEYYIMLSEAYAKGTDNPTVAAIGKNTRLLNTLSSVSGTWLNLNAGTGVFTFLTGGYYRIKTWAIVNRSGSSALNHQLIVAKDSDGTTLITGSSGSIANGNSNNFIAVAEGIINVATNDTIRVDHYLSTATGVVLGKAANVHPDAGGKELYAFVEIYLLGQ